MSDHSQGPGWWQASDDKWYPPETHPDYRPPVPLPPSPSIAPPPPGTGTWAAPAIPANLPPPTSGASPPPSGRPHTLRYLWAIGAVALIALIVGAIAALSSDDAGTDAADPRPSPGGTQPAPPSSTTTEPTTSTTSQLGTRENPYPTGSHLTTSDGLEVVLVVNLDANGAIHAANQFNDPPPSGSRYVLVTVSMTNHTEKPVSPGFALSIAGLGSMNQVHDSSACDAVEPRPLYEAPEIYPGGSTSGDACLVVPEQEINDGSLLLRVGPMFGETVFVHP